MEGRQTELGKTQYIEPAGNPDELEQQLRVADANHLIFWIAPDFEAVTGMVTVALPNDQEREENGTFESWRSNASGGTTLADQRGEGGIVDGDLPDTSGRCNTKRTSARASLGCGPYR